MINFLEVGNMISDTLSDAVAEIDYYLSNNNSCCDVNILLKINQTRNCMDELRKEIDRQTLENVSSFQKKT